MKLHKIIPTSLLLLSITTIGFGQTNNTILSISDKKSTQETVALYKNLTRTSKKAILFGHQDDLAYGVNWKYESGRSDVKDVTGDYPAVYGWDLGGIEKSSPKNLDGVPFELMKRYVADVKKRGGVNTISWHLDNPISGKNAWDNSTKSIASILPNGENHKKFKSWLDKEAKFLKSLKDEKGKAIPILYRPFHELTGNWFWWGKGNCTPEEFKKLWQFSFEYLQKKGVHNLIYVYNTADFNSKEEFLAFYPGSEYVDILSFDKYLYNDPTKDNSFVESCQKQFQIMNEVAKEQNKIMAFAETGYEAIPYNQWWTDTLMKAMGNFEISYVLVWRNHGWQEQEKKMHYYAPFKGQTSAKDFVDFYNLERIFFEKDASKENLYNN